MFQLILIFIFQYDVITWQHWPPTWRRGWSQWPEWWTWLSCTDSEGCWLQINRENDNYQPNSSSKLLQKKTRKDSCKLLWLQNHRFQIHVLHESNETAKIMIIYKTPIFQYNFLARLSWSQIQLNLNIIIFWQDGHG